MSCARCMHTNDLLAVRVHDATRPHVAGANEQRRNVVVERMEMKLERTQAEVNEPVEGKRKCAIHCQRYN